MSDVKIINEIKEMLPMLTTWFFMFVALAGAYFNATMRCKLSYVIWLLSNGFFVWHNFVIEEYAQCVMFGFYLIIAIIGVKNTIHQSGWLQKADISK